MLITNATLVTWNPAGNEVLEKAALYVDGDRLGELGPAAELERKYPDAERLDAGGQYVLPGNLCAHTHFYGAFARGMAIAGAPLKDFPDILERLWWKLDKALTPEAVRYSALVCLVDAVKHGTTTLFDHHASPNAIEGSLDILAEAVEQAGLRACLCYEVTDRDGADRTQAGIAENVRFIKALEQRPRPKLAATFGLHASLTLSNKTLGACRVARGSDEGFHIHVAEHEVDEYDSLQKSSLRVVDRLNEFGVLGPRTIAAHCVHIDAREMEWLKETGTWATHQPRSNMNNGVGVAPVEAMLRLGVRLGLGNDGFSNAMWDEWKAAYLVHKLAHRDPRRAPAPAVVEMAVTNNAALAREFFAAPLGVLAPGAYADLIFVDYHPTTPLTAGNLPWHILFGFENSMLTTTICGGQVLMKDRQLLTLDEAEITARSRELAQQAWANL